MLVHSESAARQDFGVSTGRKRASEDTTQPAIPFSRGSISLTTGWAYQFRIALLFQTMQTNDMRMHSRMKSARHSSACRWSGEVGRYEIAMVAPQGATDDIPQLFCLLMYT